MPNYEQTDLKTAIVHLGNFSLFSTFYNLLVVHLDLQYLFQIPGAETATIAANSIAAVTNGGRVCGRILNSASAIVSTTGGTVCGK